MSILQFSAVVEPHFTRSPHKVKIAYAFYCLDSPFPGGIRSQDLGEQG